MIAQQQLIADTFSDLKVIPKKIKISDATLPSPIYGDAR